MLGTLYLENVVALFTGLGYMSLNSDQNNAWMFTANLYERKHVQFK